MSPEMGPLTFGKKEEQIFLGREIAQHRDYSEDTAIKIDREVKRIIQEGFDRAMKILEDNREGMVRLAEALLEYETLDCSEIEQVIKGEQLKPRPTPPDSGSAGTPAVESKTEEERPSLPQLLNNPTEKPAPA